MNEQRLESLTGRTRDDARGGGYTWFVRVAKFALPLAALVIVGIVMGRLAMDPQQQTIADLPDQSETTAGQIELEQAKYEGVDSAGRAYVLSADSASRDKNEENKVLLKRPKAEITLTDGSWLATRATAGTYDTGTSRLTLSEDVTIFHDAGYEMKLQDIDIDVEKHQAFTPNAVEVQGPMGLLAARNLEVRDSGDLIIFGGPIALTLRNLSFDGKKPG